MKAFLMLEGLLLPIFSWMWMCAGQNKVLVECSHHNFRVVVNRALFYEDELIGPDELFLGTGCVAIYVRPNELEFNYPVSFCGIVPQSAVAIFYFNKIHCCDKLACIIKDLFSHQIFYDGSVFHSWLTYRPRNQVISTELHLQCLVPRSVQNITGSLPEYQ
ncbi:oocyte-secreted protein 3-like [Ictidomys tridecemlineatus]